MTNFSYEDLMGNENSKKKFVNELLNPDQAYVEAMQKANLQRPKNDIVERNNDKLLTNDGREMLNENK